MPLHVADAQFNWRVRVAVLWVELVLGALGGAGVLVWLWYNRRRRSRINAIIANVAVSDLLVIGFATAMQVSSSPPAALFSGTSFGGGRGGGGRGQGEGICPPSPDLE